MALKFKIVETTLNNGDVRKRLWVKKESFFNSLWNECVYFHLLGHNNPSYGIWDSSCVGKVIKEDKFQECIDFMNEEHERQKGLQVKSVKETLL